MHNKRTGRAPDFFLPSFEGYLHTQTLTPTTIRNYLADVRSFARWQLKQARVTFNSPVFHAFRQHLLRSNHSRATVNRRLNTLRLYGRFLCMQGIVKRDPTADLALVHVKTKTNGTAPHILTHAQIENLRAALHEQARPNLLRRDLAIVELMLRAALRVNEIAHLHLDSLAITNQGLGVKVDANKQVRQIPLDQGLARVLRDYIAVRPMLENNSFLFISQKGKPLSPRAIQRLVEAYARAAHLPDVSANTLRHTCVQNLVNEKRDPHMVAQWLGHKSLEPLQRYKKHKE